jgi:hypothetical protein
VDDGPADLLGNLLFGTADRLAVDGEAVGQHLKPEGTDRGM